jgi:hypothetical protein
VNTRVNPEWVELFPEKDIPIVIQDVLDVCKNLSRPPLEEKRPEEFLTKQVFKRLRFQKRYITGPLCPHIEHWMADSGGESNGRADILFDCGKGLETYFVIEAKRLFVTFPSGKKDDLIDDYIRKGMRRFVIEERYAPYQCASAMLGYVHDCDISVARDKLLNEINSQKEALLMVAPCGQSCLPVSPVVDETNHKLKSNRCFILYHLLTRIPPAVSQMSQ